MPSLPTPIDDALVAAGVPSTIGDTLLQAVAEAGYSIVSAGNTPVALSGGTKAIASSLVDGRPGWTVHAITVATSDVRYVLQVRRADGGYDWVTL